MKGVIMNYNIKVLNKEELNSCQWWNVFCHAGHIIGGGIHDFARAFVNGLRHGL